MHKNKYIKMTEHYGLNVIFVKACGKICIGYVVIFKIQTALPLDKIQLATLVTVV